MDGGRDGGRENRGGRGERRTEGREESRTKGREWEGRVEG